MSAPSELSDIGLDASRFRKQGAGEEYHGPCPRCGGKDRFVVHASREYPHWFMWCRPGIGHCGWSGWADQLNPQLARVTDEERKRWAEEKRKAEAEEKERRARALEEFTTAELWLELNRRMTKRARQWWEAQGIPYDAQNYWSLGYNPNFYKSLGGAYSIPYANDYFEIENLQYRIARPTEGDKYRWAGLGYTSHFICYPGAEFDTAVICEGAKKAMVWAWHVGKRKIQVLASPNKGDFEKSGIVKSASKYKRVYVMLDPDAINQAKELAQKIGNTSRIVRLPRKADDMVNQGYGAEYFRAVFTQARRA